MSDNALLKRACRKVASAKKNQYAATLRSVALDLGMNGIDPALCEARLIVACNESGYLFVENERYVREEVIRKNIAEGRRLAELQAPAPGTQKTGLLDPWQETVAKIPDELIHRTADGRELVTTAGILADLFNVPAEDQTTGMGRRLAPLMAAAGWQRHDCGQVKIGGKNARGYWRYTGAGR